MDQYQQQVLQCAHIAYDMRWQHNRQRIYTKERGWNTCTRVALQTGEIKKGNITCTYRLQNAGKLKHTIRTNQQMMKIINRPGRISFLFLAV